MRYYGRRENCHCPGYDVRGESLDCDDAPPPGFPRVPPLLACPPGQFYSRGQCFNEPTNPGPWVPPSDRPQPGQVGANPPGGYVPDPASGFEYCTGRQLCRTRLIPGTFNPTTQQHGAPIRSTTCVEECF